MNEASQSGPPRPDTGRAWRIFVFPAVAALIGYVVLYAWDARLRTKRGPWEVTFLAEADGTPALALAQPALGIRDVRVRFLGEQLPTNAPPIPMTVRFDRPQVPVPFGKTAFDDLMYLPGTVVLHCFGHEVQMLPRALYLNRKGHEWHDGRSFDLEPAGKLRTLDPPEKLKRLREASTGP